MSSKIIRDPLYNYISIDKKRDGWLIDLLDCPEVQRLRRIHQLGVSNITYPGADHSRLVHSLGVLHLMQLLFHQLESCDPGEDIRGARQPLLAAALLHDVGHGPYSHLLEPCLGVDHEDWSVKIILDESTRINGVLQRQDKYLPKRVADLIETDNTRPQPWQRAMLSSQLDVDRIDYLRRDSLFTGSGYGHFDWFRLISTAKIHEDEKSGKKDLVWPEKTAMAIEEYIFARYYMYQNVYLHKTTRGFEKLLEAMWRHARDIFENDPSRISLVPEIEAILSGDSGSVSVDQYLRVEESSVLSQIQIWADQQKDATLNDLASRFLNRNGFAAVSPPLDRELEPDYSEWEEQAKNILKQNGFDDVKSYLLKDSLKGKYRQPYFPEKESDDQSARNAIRVIPDGESRPVEITELRGFERLKAVTNRALDRHKYYVPKEVRDKISKIKI